MSQEVWKKFKPARKPAFLVSRDRWRDFSRARRFVRSLGFLSKAQYVHWARSPEKPKDIPLAPDKVLAYRGLWVSWDDWLR